MATLKEFRALRDSVNGQSMDPTDQKYFENLCTAVVTGLPEETPLGELSEKTLLQLSSFLQKKGYLPGTAPP